MVFCGNLKKKQKNMETKKDQSDVTSVAFNSIHSARAEVFTFGKPINWRINFTNHSELISILEERNINSVYVPDASKLNGILCEPNDFKENYYIKGIKIMSGCEAEGMVIPRGSAVSMYSADCPTIIYHDIANDILIAAHAGLASLIDRQKIIINVASRPNESVIDEMMRYTKETNHYEIFVVCGIGSQSYIYDIRDPVHGETNRKIFCYLYSLYGEDAIPRGVKMGNISLRGIIRSQFERFGINVSNIHFDNIDTYSDPNFWSHHRSFSLGKKEYGQNCTLVIHK